MNYDIAILADRLLNPDQTIIQGGLIALATLDMEPPLNMVEAEFIHQLIETVWGEPPIILTTRTREYRFGFHVTQGEASAPYTAIIQTMINDEPIYRDFDLYICEAGMAARHPAAVMAQFQERYLDYLSDALTMIVGQFYRDAAAIQHNPMYLVASVFKHANQFWWVKH